MEPDFWLNRWKKQEIGFHLSAPHPLLQKFYSDVFSQENGVFVPLCGKSTDLKFLADNNCQVLGCELSELAINDFFVENQLPFESEKIEDFTIYTSAGYKILQGDFFNLTREQIKNTQTIYDRAALIALPPAMRNDYVAHLQQLFATADMLLITLDYPPQEMDGPPFSVDKNAVNNLFSFAKVETVYEKNILDDEPSFKEKGLTQINQSAHIIRW